MARLQAPGMVLILWQGISLMPGLAEFVYDRPAPLAAVVASTILVLGWLGLAAWAGVRGASAFPWFALVVWVGIIAVLLLGIWTVALDVDGPVAPWHSVALILLFLAAGPLHGLGSALPIEDPFLRTTIVAALILISSLATYFLARRWHGRRAEAEATAVRDS